jgi:hypothetical protein
VGEPTHSERTAVHEASHALVALVFGVVVTEIRLRPGRVRFGAVMEDPMCDLCVRLAGAAGERIAFSDYDPPGFDPLEGCQDDRARADDAAWRATFDLDEMDALKAEAHSRVTDLLSENWTEVEDLAVALLKSPGGVICDPNSPSGQGPSEMAPVGDSCAGEGRLFTPFRAALSRPARIGGGVQS